MRRDAPPLPGTLRVARHVHEHVDLRRREQPGDERRGLDSQLPTTSLLPRTDEDARLLVVDDRRTGAREREPATRALGAASNRPRAG